MRIHPWILRPSKLLGYDDPDRRLSLSLLYNVSGERITGIGTFGLPDIYEQPFHQLDLVASWGFAEHWSVRLRVENLLNDDAVTSLNTTYGAAWLRPLQVLNARLIQFGGQVQF